MTDKATNHRGTLIKGTVPRDSDEAKDRFIPGLAGAQKGVDAPERTVEGICSTIELDRDGEVILPSAFKARMGKFLGSNAPFAAAHTHRAADGKPTQIGWVVTMAIEAERVPCTFRFATTEVAEEWWKLAADPNGKGIAFSIGFYPVEFVYGTVSDLLRAFPELAGPFGRAGLAPDDRVRVYTEIELVEISAVMAPSNRQSLQLLAAKMFGGDEDAAQKALAAIAEKVVEAVRTSGAAATVAEDLKAMNDVLAALRDQVAELTELLTLSPERLAQDTPPDAPPAGDESRQPGGGDEAHSMLRAAAERFHAALTQQ